MDAVRRLIAVLTMLVFFVSSTLSHAHFMPPVEGHHAPHHATMHHDMAVDAMHQHGHPDPVNGPVHPDCCSMGGCAFVAMAAPALSLRLVELVVFTAWFPTSRSLVTVPEAPPPRWIG